MAKLETTNDLSRTIKGREDPSGFRGKKSLTSSSRLNSSRPSLPRHQKSWQRKVKAVANTPDSAELQRIYSLLSQLHRRNKNQHRGQGWWKFLVLLRRNLGVLVQIEMELFAVDTASEGEQMKAEDMRRRLERSGRLDRRKGEVGGWIRGVLLPKCYVAFSSVVQDGQFAALGLTLLGNLARLGKLVGLPAVEVEGVLDVSLRQTDSARRERLEKQHDSPGPRADLDVGELIERVVARDDVNWNVSGHGGQHPSEEAGTTKSSSATSGVRKAEPKKSVAPKTDQKKRKKRSTIDDLFADLV